MGQLCKFNEPIVSYSSLATSWELCLKHLSHYTKMSSIAKKCHNLLQENAKRLLSESQRQFPKMIFSAPETTRPLIRRASPQSNESILSTTSATMTGPVVLSTGQPLPSPGPINEEIYLQMPVFGGNCPVSPATELDAHFFETMNNDMGDLDPSDPLAWAALPYLSQLETGFLDFTN